jgi:hypothetical protein
MKGVSFGTSEKANCVTSWWLEAATILSAHSSVTSASSGR